MVASFWSHGVQLIEEDYARASVASSLEDAADVRLGLSDVHVQQFWTLDREEVERARGGDRLGYERLSCSGRAVQQDA